MSEIAARGIRRHARSIHDMDQSLDQSTSFCTTASTIAPQIPY